jgi:hypothetical protein
MEERKEKRRKRKEMWAYRNNGGLQLGVGEFKVEILKDWKVG